jgi:hypothetical protein
MSVIATAVRHLMAAGVAGDELVRAISELEAAQVKPSRSSAARRQAEYRQRQKAQEDVTSDVTNATLRNGHNETSRDVTLPPRRRAELPISVDEALAIWNEMAARAGLPAARTATGKRQAMIRQRLLEHGEEGWRAAVAAVGRSEFCQGKNERSWCADIGFLLRPDNFVKAIEGGYEPRDKPSRNPLNETDLRRGIAWAEQRGDKALAEKWRQKLAEITSPVDPKVARLVQGAARSMAVSR